MFKRLFAKKARRLQPGCLSMPLLTSLDFATGPTLAELANQLFPSTTTTFESGSEEENRQILLFDSGGATVVVCLVDLPIPGDEVMETARTSFLWPDAVEKVGQCRSHAVLIGQGPPDQILDQFWACTRIAAALLNGPEAVGWYIGNANVVHEPKRVVETAVECALDGSLPLTLWVKVPVSLDGPGLHSASTIGMEAFGRPEFEVVRSSWDAKELYGLLYDLAHYVLTTGAEFRNGQTFGRSEHDRMPVEVGKSKLGKEGTVVRLVVP